MKKFTAIICFALFITVWAVAQDAAPRFAIYEDQVKLSMGAPYKDALKKLKSACEQHKVSFSWTSVAHDDNSYIHLIPIKGFADLDRNMLGELETKMGKDALGGIFAEFDKCIESSTSYVAAMLPNLSYLSPPVGENYREILFWKHLPGKDAEAEKIIMEWKALHESKKAPGGVITYKVLFGAEPGYAFVPGARMSLTMPQNHRKTMSCLEKRLESYGRKR